MASSATESHIVIFPFMSQGHIRPLLDISKALSSRGVRITIISTPSNAASILPQIAKDPRIHLTEITFPSVVGLPEGCENTAQLPSVDFLVPFLNATKGLQQSFQRVLKEMVETHSRPICVISDFFLGWTLDSCREFDIPRLVFHGMGALSMAVCKSVERHKLHRLVNSDFDPIYIPETQLKFTLTKSDLPEHYRFLDDDNPFSKFLVESGETDVGSWGVVLNSFAELEGCHLSFFEHFYRNGAKAWCIGPALLHDNEIGGNTKFPSSVAYLDWLDARLTKPASVVYTSFGTQAHMSDADIDEIAHGLEMSGKDFLWVIKSETWCPPDRFEEKVKGKGLIVRDWVEQRCVLAHPAIGGFLSHCGWNSVLESLSMGVPLLALPMNAEQPLNAKQVVDELKAGVRVETGGPSGWATLSIERQAICNGVRELIGGENGKKMKAKAEELGRAAREAVKDGGTSYRSMTELIDKLCQTSKSLQVRSLKKQSSYFGC